MARPKRSDKGGGPAAGTAGLLLEAAEREFAARGFDRARLEDIATAVGVTRPSLLHHFPTKELLYSAVVERAYTGLRSALLDAMGSGGPFVDRLDATIGRFFDHLVDHPAPAQLLMRELLDGRGPGARLLRERVSPLLDLVEAFLRSSASAVPSEFDVRAAIVDLAGAVSLYIVAGEARDALYGGAPGSAGARARYVALARGMVAELSPGRRPARSR